MVPAPGLFSIMTVAPRSFAISCASVRAITSVPPPGANGTTILTILSGYNAEASSGENAVSDNTLAAEVPGMHQQIMPARVAPCAGQLADMTRDMRPAMDAGNNDRLASIPNKKQTSVFGEDIMKHWLIGLLLLTGPSAFAQQAVPTIGFDSIPNPIDGTACCAK